MRTCILSYPLFIYLEVVWFFGAGILDEDADDTLINVNILDEEKAAVNIENKKKKPTYQPYDEDEFDDHGMVSNGNLSS